MNIYELGTLIEAKQGMSITELARIDESTFPSFESASTVLLKRIAGLNFSGPEMTAVAVLRTTTPAEGQWEYSSRKTCAVDGKQRVVTSTFVNLWFCSDDQFVVKIASLYVFLRMLGNFAINQSEELKRKVITYVERDLKFLQKQSLKRPNDLKIPEQIALLNKVIAFL